MSFEITSAKYNCSDNTIDIEYIGKYDGRSIVLNSHIDNIIYPASISGNKLIPSAQLVDKDGYDVNSYDPKTGNLQIDCFFYVDCDPKSPCKGITIKRTPVIESNSCLREVNDSLELQGCAQVAYSTKIVHKSGCTGKQYSSHRGAQNIFMGLFKAAWLDGGCSDLNYFESSRINVYNKCTRCLVAEYGFEVNSPLNKITITYDCNLGLYYNTIPNINLEFFIFGDNVPISILNPKQGTKLPNGRYFFVITSCPNDESCKYRAVCKILNVKCIESEDKFDNKSCFEDVNDIISIQSNQESCTVKITNKSSKLIKVKRELLSSFDRSCSGSVTKSFNEITLFPLQSAIIRNECFGHDARLSIEYQSGVNICNNTLCLPPCDLSAINETSDIKAPTVNGGLIKDGKVVSFFNPLENGHSNVSIYIGDDVFSGLIPPGGYYVFKIPYSTKSFEYRLTTNKNNEVEFIGTFNGTFSSEIKTGIPYSYIEDGQIYIKTT